MLMLGVFEHFSVDHILSYAVRGCYTVASCILRHSGRLKISRFFGNCIQKKETMNEKICSSFLTGFIALLLSPDE